jgi:hypothetical protein
VKSLCSRFLPLSVAQRNIPKGHSKAYAHKFIENLFKINMSEDVLVDMVIDEGSDENKTFIVGRPKLLGSSAKQIRHVTPYSFLEYAIKSVIMKVTDVVDYLSYIDSMVDAVLPLIKGKKGICLKDKEYLDLLSSVSSKDEIDEVFKFATVTSEQQRNEYHLIYNDTLIEVYKQSRLDEGIKQQAFDDFNSKFEKYINYGLLYLKNEIIDPSNLNIVTNFCEGFARIILTIFNQDKYTTFS